MNEIELATVQLRTAYALLRLARNETSEAYQHVRFCKERQTAAHKAHDEAQIRLESLLDADHQSTKT